MMEEITCHEKRENALLSAEAKERGATREVREFDRKHEAPAANLSDNGRKLIPKVAEAG
jgi:hypothetical protein